MSLVISDKQVFCKFLSTISRIVPSCKFNIDNNGCSIYATTENKSIRVISKTNSITTEKPVDFCLNDITKLVNIFDILPDKDVELKLDNTFLYYSGSNKFKFKTIKEDVITNYISKDITSELKPSFTFTTTVSNIKNSIRFAGTISGNVKVFLTLKENSIIADFYDNENIYSDSVGLVITDDSSAITGTLDKVLCISLDNYKILASLPVDNLKISLVQNVLLIENENKEGNFISTKILSTLLR